MVHEQMVNGFFAAKLLQILRISKPSNMFYSIFSKHKNTTHYYSACCIFRFSFRNLSNKFPYIRPMPIFIFSSQIALFRHFYAQTGTKKAPKRSFYFSEWDGVRIIHLHDRSEVPKYLRRYSQNRHHTRQRVEQSVCLSIEEAS